MSDFNYKDYLKKNPLLKEDKDKKPMSDEELEDLETRADDHFSEPIKETLDDDVWIKVDALKNNLR